LNNFLSDIPAIGLADDSVDKELIERPRRWDMNLIRRFMIQFGLLSSVFDFITFGLLYGILHAGPELFRTGWFVESLLTEIAIALVVRTRRPFFRSKPGALLLWSSIAIGAMTPVIPLLPYADMLGFVPLSLEMTLVIGMITAAYVVAVEIAKPWFFRQVD
jgi:Mg2+-importing ATPase